MLPSGKSWTPVSFRGDPLSLDSPVVSRACQASRRIGRPRDRDVNPRLRDLPAPCTLLHETASSVSSAHLIAGEARVLTMRVSSLGSGIRKNPDKLGPPPNGILANSATKKVACPRLA